MFAAACTLCHSDVAAQVRAALAADPHAAALILAPAPAIVALWWWLTRG